MKNASDDIFDEIFRFIKKIPREPKKIYAAALILMVLFPPMSTKSGSSRGWSFITDVGGSYRINTTYMIIEFVLATILFFLFRNKNK